MSMRNYGVETVGLVIDFLEFIELLKLNKDILDEPLEDEEIEGLEINEAFDIANNIGFASYTEIDGEIQELDNYGVRQYLDQEDVFVLELEKQGLFESYKDKEEIYNELLKKLNDNGINNVDLEYVKSKTGWLKGSYFG